MTQYIGARYVPKFMGTYDNTQAYENMCVVDNGLGTSYISKKPTPAGTPLTDTDYWAIYGSTNGAIINLQNQIDTINNVTIPAIYDTIERNILVIGNSFVTYGCANLLMADFAHSYKRTSGGIGFSTYAGHSTTFESILDNAIIDSDIDNDTITDILFVSAMGDSRAYNEGANNYYTTLDTTLASIQTKISANFPNCKNVSITLAESRECPYFSDNKLSSLFGVHKAFIDFALKYNMRYIGWSGFNILYKSGMFEADQYHPSSAGVDAIGAFIRASYYGHVEYVTHVFNQTVDCSFASGAHYKLISQLTPDVVSIQCRAISNIANQPNTATFGAEIFSSEGTNRGLPAPPYPLELWTSIVRQDLGLEIEKVRLSLRANTNGVMGGILASYLTSITTWGNYDLNIIGLDNITYPIVVTP